MLRSFRAAIIAVVTSVALLAVAPAAASAQEGNEAPQIHWIAPATLQEGETAWFRAWVTDRDGVQFDYSWDLGDGTTFYGSGVTGGTPPLLHTYAQNGTYTVTLTVDDGEGGVTSRSVDVVVGGSPLVGTGLLRNVGSIQNYVQAQCIDVDTYAVDAPVILAPCDGESVDQWRFTDGTVENVDSGYLCLDVVNSESNVPSYATHTPIVLNYCYGGGGQQWRPDGYGRLVSVGSGFTQCIDIRSYATGTQLTLFPCYEGSTQRWIR